MKKRSEHTVFVIPSVNLAKWISSWFSAQSGNSAKTRARADSLDRAWLYDSGMKRKDDMGDDGEEQAGSEDVWNMAGWLFDDDLSLREDNGGSVVQSGRQKGRWSSCDLIPNRELIPICGILLACVKSPTFPYFLKMLECDWSEILAR